MSEQQQQPRKRPKKAPPPDDEAPTLTPVALTLEPGQVFSFGARALVATEHPPQPEERFVPPPRERQNAHTLAQPGQRAIVELLELNNAWQAQAPEDALRAVAAPELVVDAFAIEQKRRGAGAPTGAANPLRMINPGLGPLMPTYATTARAFVEHGFGHEATARANSGAERLRLLYLEDRVPREMRFFAADPLIDPELPFGRAPDEYPAIQQLRAQYQAHFGARHETLATAAGLMPRRSIVWLNRAYFVEFRRAPEDSRALSSGGARPCCNGARGACLFTVLAWQQGHKDMAYVACEFLLPREVEAWNTRRSQGVPVSEAVDGPLRPCIDCLLCEWDKRVNHDLQLPLAPPEPFNTFRVFCDKGEYDVRCMLPEKVNKRPTGIEGWVPRYTTHSRQYQMVKAPGGHFVSFLAEVGMDFWSSLSEANACLGARKSQPLNGDAPRFVRPATPATFLPRRALERAAGEPAAWLRFVRGAPTCILADRVQLYSVETMTRVPAAWLRRTLTLPIPEGDCVTVDAARTWVRDCALADEVAALLGVTERHALPQALLALANAALGTFERSMALWLEAMRGGRLAWALGPLAALLGPDVTWRHRLGGDPAGDLPLPSRRLRSALFDTRTLEAVANVLLPATAEAEADAAAGAPPPPPSFVLWAVVMWRVAVANLVAHVLHPWAPHLQSTCGARFIKETRYFVDTHLDWLTRAYTRQQFADAAWFAADAVELRRFYPQANRVCCVEELPDWVCALLEANPWFDKGNKKAQASVFQAFLHVYLGKVWPQVCQRRQFSDIIQRHVEAYAGFRNLTRLVMRAVALGNLPGAVHVPPLMVRLRINAALGMGADALTTDAALVAWIAAHPMLTLFMLREYFLYTVECDGVLDGILCGSTKWPRFKTFVRSVNGHWRRELTRQTRADATVPVVWDALEHLIYRPDGKPKDAKGVIMAFHDKAAKLNSKLKKDTWQGVMARKMTAVETALLKKHAPAVAEAVAWLRSAGRLDACRLVAWVTVQRMHALTTSLRTHVVMELGYLKALGMTEHGLWLVRQWQFEYYEYDTADDNMKKKALTLFAHAPRDYVLFKTFLKLVESYGNERPFFLSIEATLMQFRVLRAAIGIEATWATPPTLGHAYYCERCHTWATAVAPVSPALNTIPSTGKHKKKKKKKKQKQQQEDDDDDEESVPVAPEDAPPLPTLAQLAIGTNAPNGHVVSVRAAYYNPMDDGKLYCHRCSRNGATARLSIDALLLADEEEEEEQDEDDDADAVAQEAREDADDDAWLILDRAQNVRAWATANARRLEQLAQGGEAVAAAAAAAPAQKKKPKKKKHRDIGRMATAEDLAVARPLVAVDMVGIYQQMHHQIYARCVHCGGHCEMQNCTQTNGGQTCGRHALSGELGHDHRLWAHMRLSPTYAADTFATLQPATPVPRVRCFACRAHEAAQFIETYDFAAKRWRMPLCVYHVAMLQGLLPLPLRGVVRDYAPPPVRVDVLVNTLFPRYVLFTQSIHIVHFDNTCGRCHVADNIEECRP